MDPLVSVVRGIYLAAGIALAPVQLITLYLFLAAGLQRAAWTTWLLGMVHYLSVFGVATYVCVRAGASTPDLIRFALGYTGGSALLAVLVAAYYMTNAKTTASR